MTRLTRKITITIFIAIISFLLTLFLPRSYFHFSKSDQLRTTPVLFDNKDTEEPGPCHTSNIAPCEQFPWLDLPMAYFSRDDVRWGSGKENTKGDSMNTYDLVALNNTAVYQSYPTTTDITIENYSTEIKTLKTKTIEDIKMKNAEFDLMNFEKERIDETYQKYGDLATHYLPLDYIQWTNSFDVDDDGIDEAIVMWNYTGAINAGSYHADIVKDNKIIFSVIEDNAEIVPADTPNGFYVEWRSPEDESANCCPNGFMRTRFVYENDKFIPVYEQQVIYLVVGNRNDR